MSDDWYRGAAWQGQAQELFEKKIKRARNQKAFYLWIKARAIASEYGSESDELFQRSLDCDDPFETGRALQAWTAALAERGDVDGSMDLLARCARGERGNVGIQLPTAKWDFAFMVGAHRQRARYEEALELLGPSLLIPKEAFSAQAGLAFIRHDQARFQSARKHAVSALGRALAGGEEIPGLTAQYGKIAEFPHPLYDRLLVIAGKWDEDKLGPPPPVWPENL